LAVKIGTFTAGHLHRSLSLKRQREKGKRKILTQPFELRKEIENILCIYYPIIIIIIIIIKQSFVVGQL
jgi:hypothetical protein